MQCQLRLQSLAELRLEAYERVRGDTLTAEGERRSDCELEFQAFESGEEMEAYNIELMFPDATVNARIDSANAAHGIRNTGELGRALFNKGLLQYRFRAFASLRMPVLVVAGVHDRAVPMEGLRELVERLPNARFIAFEESGHFMFLDEPRRFADEIARFLRADTGSGQTDN
jgi:proline iminopeptidase